MPRLISAPLSAKTCASQSEWNGGSSGSSMIAGKPAIPPTSLTRLTSGPDRGDDDRGDGQGGGGGDQAGGVERHLHERRAQLARRQQVQNEEGHHLQRDTDQPEDHRVPQRRPEPARRVRPDRGEGDRALAQEAGGQGDRGVYRALLVDVPCQVAGGQQVERDGPDHEEQDADAGVGGGVADAGQHEDLRGGDGGAPEPRAPPPAGPTRVRLRQPHLPFAEVATMANGGRIGRVHPHPRSGRTRPTRSAGSPPSARPATARSTPWSATTSPPATRCTSTSPRTAPWPRP